MMNSQQEINYKRIAEAIAYLTENFSSQPDLDMVAKKIHVSPYHFQRMFTEWAGVSPKKFLQYINLAHAKNMLKNTNATLWDAALETGLSGTGRLHDLFVNIEGMTPGEYKNGGEDLRINYNYAVTPFGNVLVASTHKGICYMAFADDDHIAMIHLQQHFPKAKYINAIDHFQQDVLSVFDQDLYNLPRIKLHVKGSPFQLKVWEALLLIPTGKLATYGAIANAMQQPKAARAVGTAIGNNPIAYIIPCHRVIQATGILGGYMWGSTRKKAIIGWEAARLDNMKHLQ